MVRIRHGGWALMTTGAILIAVPIACAPCPLVRAPFMVAAQHMPVLAVAVATGIAVLGDERRRTLDILAMAP